MLSLYCSSKFAVEGLSESLSYELASQNIRIKIIEPGGVVSTAVGSRSAQEAEQNTPPVGYADFVTATGLVFQNLRSSRLATEQDVANVIFAAATDGSAQLRYVATEEASRDIRSGVYRIYAHYIPAPWRVKSHHAAGTLPEKERSMRSSNEVAVAIYVHHAEAEQGVRPL